MKRYIHAILHGRSLAPLRWVRRAALTQFGYLRHSLADGFWNGLVNSVWMPTSLRMGCYRRKPRLRMGKSVWIQPKCTFDRNQVSIANGCYINRGVSFFGAGSITIGENCAVGCEAMFVTVTHEGTRPDFRAAGATEMSITIGNGVWIAARATLLPGSVVEDGCIVAAGAVVTGRCVAHGLYAGVPARRIKELPR